MARKHKPTTSLLSGLPLISGPHTSTVCCLSPALLRLLTEPQRTQTLLSIFPKSGHLSILSSFLSSFRLAQALLIKKRGKEGCGGCAL